MTPNAYSTVSECPGAPGFTRVTLEFYSDDEPYQVDYANPIVFATFDSSDTLVQVSLWYYGGDGEHVLCCDGVHPTTNKTWGAYPGGWGRCDDVLETCLDTRPPPVHVPTESPLAGCGCGPTGSPRAGVLLLLGLSVVRWARSDSAWWRSSRSVRSDG